MSNGHECFGIRHGFGSVRPYLYGNLDFPDLIKKAFDGEELERLPTPLAAFISKRESETRGRSWR